MNIKQNEVDLLEQTKGNKYDIILADPPWSYQQFSEKKHGSAKAHYDLMSNEDLYELPVEAIAKKDCVLFMWATFPKLKEAITLLESWGFRYVTVAFVWVKLNKGGVGYFHGVGFHTASNVEIVLLGKKGNLKRVDNSISQLIVSKLRQHSRKPDELYVKIEKLYGGDKNKIELFARERREGWDVFGNQLRKSTQKILNADKI